LIVALQPAGAELGWGVATMVDGEGEAGADEAAGEGAAEGEPVHELESTVTTGAAAV
jgi:hypothetical protein